MAKKKNLDPYAEREAQKYEHPIPSREYIIEYLRECGKPVRAEELIKILKLKSVTEQEALSRRLRAMERDGQLILNRKNEYGLPEKMDLIRGRVLGHRDGFGFVVPEDGSDDLFLSARQMRRVFHRDKVLVHVAGVDRKGRREAAIVEVLERAQKTIVGRFFDESGVTFVVPDNKRISQDILVPPSERNGAKRGQIVTVEIISPPTMRAQALGRVVEVLGEHMAPGMEIDVAVRNYDIPHVWSSDVQIEIVDLKEKVSTADLQGRTDLRSLPFVTIDGEDAKDFDDAVYCEQKKGRGWILYVAIADVSHYVQPDTALDKEALQRGTSVYFPGEVVPMLPEILSNGLCSLKPKVDRLCLVSEISISAAGKTTDYKFYRGVIHSNARLTYTEVSGMLDAKNNLATKANGSLLPHLKTLEALYNVLKANREARGAIDFESTDTKVVFGPERKIKQIVPVERTVAHRIIEECMLLANVSAAHYVSKKKVPLLFRVHEGPNPEKLQDLRKFLNELGLSLPGRKEPKTADYAQLLRTIETRPDKHLIQTMLLRSLSQAVYSPNNSGHFGLAYDAYTHFTSPIRRYPDLLLHRAITYILDKPKRKFNYDHETMVGLGEHCSMTERRADEATRDALDWLKCEFIKDRVGEEFDGIVSNVTAFGLFVELQNIYVEGLIHVTALKNDYYHFDPVQRSMSGERTGTTYRLADCLKVRVARVDLESRQIDFELVETKSVLARPAKKKRVKKRRK